MAASTPVVSGQAGKSDARKVAPHLFAASIAKKAITALTGLFLCGFLAAHLLGNLLILWAADGGSSNRYGRFNEYGRFLNALPFLIVVELGLAAIFLMHAYQAMKVTYENYRARPQRYAVKKWGRSKSKASRKSWSSTFMAVTGSVLLLFTILHVWHFKYNRFQKFPEVPANGNGMNLPTHDLAQLVIVAFKSPVTVFLYVAAILCVGAHLWHAVWSAFQTLGVSNPKARRFLIGFGNVFTVVVTLGFLSIPIWAYFKGDEPWTKQKTVSPAVAQGASGNTRTLGAPTNAEKERANDAR